MDVLLLEPQLRSFGRLVLSSCPFLSGLFLWAPAAVGVIAVVGVVVPYPFWLSLSYPLFVSIVDCLSGHASTTLEVI